MQSSVPLAADSQRGAALRLLGVGTWLGVALATCRGAMATVVPALRAILNL